MAKKMAKKGKRMAMGGPAGYGGNKTNDPVGRGGMGGTGLGGVSGGINAGGGGRGGPAGGVTTGTMTGTSARNMRGTSRAPEFKAAGPSVPMNRMNKPKMNRPAKPAIETPLEQYNPPEVTDDMLPGYSGREPLAYETMGPMFKRSETGTNFPGQGRGSQFSGRDTTYPGGYGNFGLAGGNTRPGMRGGGLARKGKGLTMAKGGLVKGSGCASKGVKKPRYT